MPKTTVVVRFKRCIQDSQTLGSGEHMVSRVFFDIAAEGKTWHDLEVRLKQPVGESYEEGPLEVGAVIGSYGGPMDHSAFSKCVEEYYRSLVGSTGFGINVPGGVSVRMRDNTFEKASECRFQATADTSDTW